MRKAILIALGFTFTVLVIVYGSFAAYEGSWALSRSTTAHSLQIQQQQANGQASIAANGWNYQTTLGQEIVAGITNVYHDTTSADQYKAAHDSVSYTNEIGQRAYDAGQVCYDASQVNSALPRENPDTTFIKKNCLGGVLSPLSVYYVNSSN